MAKRLGKVATAFAVMVAGTFGTLALGTAAPAGADTVSAETAFVNAINQLRQSKGLRPLGVDPRLVTVARNWSANMASQNKLYHNPSLASQAPSDWTKLGENVGYGPNTSTIHDAFVKSPGHYANLVDAGFNAMGIGVVMAGNTMWVTEVFENSPSAPPPSAQSAPSNPTQGYWMVARDGGVFSFGLAGFKGSTGGLPLNQPIVSMAKCKCGGYWFVAADGGIFAFNAPFYGSTGGLPLNQPIVGMAATPSGLGYWLVARDGGIFAYGDAKFYGSTGGMKLNQPIVGMASTKSGKGYWLVARDGGIFAYGDAAFKGSTGGMKLNQPIVSMAANPAGTGYWFVAADGGIFAFGDAGFYGSGGGQPLGSPVVSMAAAPNGAGYRLVTATGYVLAFGSAEFDGAINVPLNQPIVGMASV
jgi:Cysteine-rich secretory protein family